ncbi:HAMP domain-containing histidine kinase, partial [bacterium]|nr:HAMP domain-containing histidine kinase [bacterium]
SYNCSEERVLGDEFLLKQAYINLFTNAIEAIEKKGNITIEVSCDEKYVYTYFKNDGPPIKNEDIEKVFEIYFSTKKTGSGLGLTMVKRIIEEHSGSIEIEPRKNGTSFKISLRRI